MVASVNLSPDDTTEVVGMDACAPDVDAPPALEVAAIAENIKRRIGVNIFARERRSAGNGLTLIRFTLFNGFSKFDRLEFVH